jgi:hypothetical protein
MLLTRRVMILSAASFVAGRCGGGDVGPPPSPPPPSPPGTVNLDFSFATNFAGWEPAYADYTLGQEASIDFAFGHERLPDPLDSRSGIFLSSNNRSDDVFMYATRLLDGLERNTRYRVDLSITLATNAPPNCPGVGGSPGEGVALKAGAVGFRPENVIQTGNFVTVNFDKGNQTQGGNDVVAIGNLAQTTSGSCTSPVYRLKTLSIGSSGPIVTSDSSGRIWLVIGTDSGFEGLTKVYFLEGTATLRPI